MRHSGKLTRLPESLRILNLPSAPKRTLTIATLLVLLVVVGVLVRVDAEVRANFARVSNTVHDLGQEVLEPLGAVERTDMGGGFGRDLAESLSCAFSTQRCPIVTRHWIMPIEPGAEMAAVRAVLIQAGFTQFQPILTSPDSCTVQDDRTCTATSRRDDLYMTVGVSEKAPFDDSLDHSSLQDQSPRQWMQLNVSVSSGGR